MPNRLKAVIFDIDGTLIDSVDFHALSWQEVFHRHGFDVPFGALRSQIGKGGDQLMPVFLPPDVVAREGKAIEAERKELFLREYLPRLHAFPGVRELFERIRADGLRIALASSAKADELAAYKRIAGIEDLVEAETSGDDAKRSKPFPDIFEAALVRLGDVTPNEVMAVGDTPYDAEAAGRLGLKAIGVLCGGFPEAELRKAGCIEIYQDPEDLLRNYERSPLAAPVTEMRTLR